MTCESRKILTLLSLHTLPLLLFQFTAVFSIVSIYILLHALVTQLNTLFSPHISSFPPLPIAPISFRFLTSYIKVLDILDHTLKSEVMPSTMEITNVTEFEAIAKEKLPKMIYEYYASGAEDQWSLKENRNAFSRIL
ncbi:hypothetical protein Ahy_B03g061888 isoform C [Arachis hypogaea]|nr:hypothetical protein Ahy_B03g061888 isoform C [Arachis hypogaea]